MLDGFEYYVAADESQFIAADALPGRQHEAALNPAPRSAVRSPQWVTVQPGRIIEKMDFRFAPFKKGTWKNYGTVDGLPGPNVYSVTGGSDGAIWVGTFAGGLARFDGKRFESSLQGDRTVYVLRSGPDGAIWFGDNRGLGRITASGIKYWSSTKARLTSARCAQIKRNCARRCSIC